MACDSFRAQLEPEDLLFRNRNPEHELTWREQIRAAETTFVDHVLRIELAVMVLPHPCGAQLAADLFIGDGEEQYVARKRDLQTFQHQKRIDLANPDTFH